MRFARLRSVRVGAITLDKALAMLAPPALEGSNWGHDLVIGYGFMRDYVVTFDCPRRRIILAR